MFTFTAPLISITLRGSQGWAGTAAGGGADQRSAKNPAAPMHQSREAHHSAQPHHSPEGASRPRFGRPT